MYKSLRYLAIMLIVVVPAVAIGRQATDGPSPHPAPCPAPSVVIVQPNVYVELPAQPAAPMKFDAEKRKTFERTYKVNSSDLLNIENRYGRVHVNTWDKNEIRVKVDMIAQAGSESKANDMLSRMRVEEVRDGKTIYLKTVYEPVRVSGPSSSEINYTIYMPADNSITLKNTYGDVYLANLKGSVNVELKYGNLKSERLTNTSNNLKLSYSNGSCSYINGGSLQVAYSNVQVAEAKDLRGYSKYSDLMIGKLSEALNIDMKYGSFRVSDISNKISNIRVASTYTPISLNFADNSAFNFDVNVQYADFKVNKDLVNITSMEKGYTSADYKGRFGTASPKAEVSITSKYGDVRFTK